MMEGHGHARQETARAIRFAVGLLLLVGIVAIAGNAADFDSSGIRTPGPRNVLPIESGLSGDGGAEDRDEPREPIEIPQPILIGVDVAAGIALIRLISKQQFSWSFRRPTIRIGRTAPVQVSDESDDAEAIAEFARDLIDELNEGDSPRHAIQRAYAAVETGFGSDEFVRRPAETPLRYLDRIFGRHRAVRQPLEQLTELFQRARFSHEPVDEAMRAEAIAALSDIRDYYTTASWRKVSNRRRTRVAT